MSRERRHFDTQNTENAVQHGLRVRPPASRSNAHSAELYLALLGKARATFQTFADFEGTRGRPTILHGTHESVAPALRRLNAWGHGIFVMVNHGDERGRRTDNVVAVTAYFSDFDGVSPPDAWPIPPTMVIESSPDRFHTYWRVADAPLEEFPRVQAHLAHLFGSDDKVTDLPRVMRLPGYLHRKGRPFETRVLQHRDVIVRHEDFVDAINLPDAKEEQRNRATSRAPMPTTSGMDRLRRYVWSAVQGEHDNVAAAGEGSRNDTLHKSAIKLGSLVGAGMLDELDAREALLAGAAAATDPLPGWEARRTIDSGLRYGIAHPRQVEDRPS